MDQFTVPELLQFVREEIARRGFLSGDTESEDGFLTLRLKSRFGDNLGSVTLSPNILDMGRRQAEEFILGSVLEAARAAAKEPVTRSYVGR